MKLLAGCVMVIGLGAGSAWAGAAEGKELYAKSCKSCHGAEGQGNPSIAKVMKVEMRSLASKEVQAQSDSDLKNVIVKGKGKMKPVAGISAKQADDIVAFLRTLRK